MRSSADEREHAVKATYLYNFGIYADWPEPPNPFTIGVLGEDPFGMLLEEIAQKRKIKGAPIQIRRFKNAQQLVHADILYIASPELLAPVEEALREKPVLIVTDGEGLAQKGAVINFYIEEGRVRFEVNRKAAVRKNLKLNSQLLRYARLVE